MTKSIFKPLALLLAGTLFVTPGFAQHDHQKDIVDTAVAAGNFTTLAAALQAADLIDVLKSEGPFTVFAPTDEAFAALDKKLLAKLLEKENKGMLSGILTYHVVPGSVAAADVVKLNGAKTVNGQRVDIKVEGKKVMIDGATVVMTDIMASNGIIHVINQVIQPSANTIPEVAASANQFKTLLAAVGAADLAGVLSGDGPFTVFAPTDEAFAALPNGTVEGLLKPENKTQLQNLLKYHVVSGRLYSEDVVGMATVATLTGQKLSVSTKGGAKINGANLVATDIDASNGVIHVVDGVLMPKAKM